MSDYNQLCQFMRGRMSTGITHITWPCKLKGRYIIVGSIPGTCCGEGTGKSRDYATEGEALAAILADPWIVAHPEQVIQRSDCSKVQR